MSIKQKLLKVLSSATLLGGLLMGAPMRPDEIEELLHRMNQPKVAHTLREEDDTGDGR